ncbi:MAG: hypothetical protein KAS02_00690 [Candidatus Pacebacteria bacterium]|nr:hypothetical protein [Candidatus Paceibacterota bacterium]
MDEISRIKISYKNWLSSVQKWIKILRKVQKRESFSNNDGFKSLVVMNDCGYCEESEFLGNEFCGCQGCHLHQKQRMYFPPGMIVGKKFPVCFSYVYPESHFSLFVSEMRKNFVDFEVAEYHSEIILDTILKDCPDKGRAKRDGIVVR